MRRPDHREHIHTGQNCQPLVSLIECAFQSLPQAFQIWNISKAVSFPFPIFWMYTIWHRNYHLLPQLTTVIYFWKQNNWDSFWMGKLTSLDVVKRFDIYKAFCTVTNGGSQGSAASKKFLKTKQKKLQQQQNISNWKWGMEPSAGCICIRCLWGGLCEMSQSV